MAAAAEPPELSTTVTQTQETLDPVAKSKPARVEKYQLVYDKDVPLNIVFNKQSDLTAEAYETLDKLAMVMNNDPSVEIVLHGYARGFGSAEYHKKMSEFSANIVKGYLVGKGVDESRIQAMGMLLKETAEDTVASGGRLEQTWVEIVLSGSQ